MSKNNRIVILGGPGRGKTTFGKALSEEHRLTHLCTDPQRMLSADMNGTPDHLEYGGEHGVGQWVAREWFGRDRTLIEGVKAADALRRALNSGHLFLRSSSVCDRVILLTELTAGGDELPGQRRQHDHVMKVVHELGDKLDNIEHWYPVGGHFRRVGH
jgi:hypothetical protein